MAQRDAKIEINDLTGGLNTDSTELTSRTNTTTDEDNFDITKEGTRKRRRAFALETGTTTISDIEDKAIANFRWEAVAKNGNRNFEVIQVGNILYFYDVSFSPLYMGKKSFTVNLNNFKAPLANQVDYRIIDGTSGKGAFWVTGETVVPFYIEYDEDADTISTTKINIEIRDLTQLDTTDPETEGTSLSSNRRYDLLNQGWYQTGLIVGSSSQTRTVTIHEGDDVNVLGFAGAILDGYFNTFGKYPPKTKPWWVGKGAVTVNVHEKRKGVFNDNDFTKDFQSFSKETYDLYFGGNNLAPLGHYIIDPFYKDRSTASGVKGLTTEKTKKRPTAIAFYSGRIFYALDNTMYFSQVILDDLGASARCYQEADPTAEDTIGLVASDGGVITIPEMGNVLRMMVVEGTLMIFADNGVWFLFTPSGQGFRADSFQVDFVTSSGIVGQHTLVDVEGRPYWWSDKGIYTVQSRDGRVGYTAVDITTDKINNYYNDSIPIWSKKWAKGEYDSTERTVRWVHGSDVTDTGTVTVAALTYNDAFAGDVTDDDMGTNNVLDYLSSRHANSHYVWGEDGNTYAIVSDEAAPDNLYAVDMSDGSISDTLSDTTMFAAADAAPGFTSPMSGSTWDHAHTGMRAAPIRGTQYFWIAIDPVFSIRYYLFLLYKINSTGDFELAGGFAYNDGVSGDPDLGTFVGSGFLGDNPTSAKTLIAMDDGTDSAICVLPSLSSALSTYTISTGTSSWNNIKQELSGTYGNNFFAATTSRLAYTQKVSFLPTGSDSCKIIYYVGASEADVGSNNTTIATAAATYANGFLLAGDISTSGSAPGFTVGSIAVDNTIFNDSGSSPLIPWADAGKEVDDSTGTDDDDYVAPAVVYVGGSYDTWLVLWSKIYSINTNGLYSDGSYVKVISFSWNTSTSTATYQDEAEGSYFVPGTDTGNSKYTATPRAMIPGFFNGDYSALYVAAAFLDGITGGAQKDRWVFAKLSDYTPALTTVINARFAMDSMLNYTLKFDSFYPYSYAITSSPVQYVAGIIRASTIATETSEVQIVDENGVDVVDEGLTAVVVDFAFETNNQRGIKYPAVVGGTGLEFGEFDSETFLDWGTEDATAYLTTFYHIEDDSMRYMWSPWVYTYLKRTGTTYVDQSGDGTI